MTTFARQITRGFSDSYFTGAEVLVPTIPWPWPCAIQGHVYTLEWSKFQRSTVSPYRDARDSNALPGESSLNNLAAWKRNRDDWGLGAGQQWSDRALQPYNQRIEIEPRMYYSSKGINPWIPGQFQLHRDTELCVAGAGPYSQFIVMGTSVYYIDAGAIYRSQDMTATTPTRTACSGYTGTPRALTTDGSRIYLSTSVGMFVATATAFSALAGAAATYAPTLLEWVNGWLFGVVGNVVSEIRQTGVVNTVFTHLNNSFVFNSATGSPSHAYFGGQGTDQAEVYSVGVKDDGTLGPGIWAMGLPRGESLGCMEYYGDVISLGTSKGVRVAQLAGDGSLILSRLVVSIAAGVTSMVAESQFVWCGWSNYDGISSGLGRMDLSTNTDTQERLPAYASDLMWTAVATVGSCFRYLGRTFFTIDGIGIIRDHATNRVPVGTLSMGRFRWGTYEPKAFLGIEIVSDPLNGNRDGLISASVIHDDMISTSLGSRGESNSSTGVGVIMGVGSVASSYDWFEPQITLNRATTNPAASPMIRRITLRALPTPKTVDQFILPILMASTVDLEVEEGQEQAYDTQAEYSFLQQLVQSGNPVAFQIFNEQHLVTVREVGWVEVHGLNPNRTGPVGILQVTLITAEV